MLMKNIFRKLILILIIVNINTAVAAEAYPQFAVNLINKMSNRFFEIAISSARAFAKITYKDVRFDTSLDTFFISGLEVFPYTDNKVTGCEIKIGSINISGTRNENSSSESFLIGLSDLYISNMCLPYEARSVLSLARIKEIKIPFLNVEADHEYKTAATNFIVYGELEDAVGITMAIDLNYLSLRYDYVEPVIANLSTAHLTVENFGLWKNISNEIPKEFTQFGVAGKSAALIASRELKTILTAYTADQISAQIGDAVNDFINDPGSITISTEVIDPKGIRLDLSMFNNINFLIEELNPNIFANASSTKTKVSKIDLNRILGGQFNQFDQQELFDLANNFNDGNKAPKNLELAKKAYIYLAEKGHLEANERLIRLYLSKSDFKNAYLMAQRLGAAGNKSAPAYFNAIEKQISLVEIMKLQSQTVHLKPTEMQDNRMAHDLARSYLTGNGTTKSFERSYFWALIARASGDIRADLIINKLENMKSKMPKLEGDQWSDRLDQIQTNATKYWMNQN
jgi:hypothetical protein